MQQTLQYHETNGFAHPLTLTIKADVVRTKKQMNAHRIIKLQRNIKIVHSLLQQSFIF